MAFDFEIVSTGRFADEGLVKFEFAFAEGEEFVVVHVLLLGEKRRLVSRFSVSTGGCGKEGVKGRG